MRLKCPECRKAFPWDANTPWPKICPLCLEDIDNDDNDGVVMPFIRSAKTTNADKVYRDMEAASEVRAAQAAEMAGVPVADMAPLKITNFKDARHPGDIAAMPVDNAVSQMMRQTPGMTGFQGSNGVEWGGAVGTGPGPHHVGANFRNFVKNNHRDMVMQHAVGKDEHGRPAMPNTNVTSDRPARETLQPGYIPRG